jgi:hypothetical protein
VESHCGKLPSLRRRLYGTCSRREQAANMAACRWGMTSMIITSGKNDQKGREDLVRLGG